MKTLLHYSSTLFVIGLFFINCDETVSPENNISLSPAVEQLTINPNQITFLPQDGFKDTTISIEISALIRISEEYTAGYVVRDKQTGKLITSGIFDQDYVKNFFYTPFLHQINASLRTSTTAFENYIVEAYAYNTEAKGNFVQTSLSINGLSNNNPEILEILSPEGIDLPSSGTTEVKFIAKVKDKDGQATIQNVFLRLISRITGELSGSPFLLLDNGTSGDETPNDSLFTTAFNLSSENNPETYDVEYFAIDKGGLYSDTVRTTFQIRGN